MSVEDLLSPVKVSSVNTKPSAEASSHSTPKGLKARSLDTTLVPTKLFNTVPCTPDTIEDPLAGVSVS